MTKYTKKKLESNLQVDHEMIFQNAHDADGLKGVYLRVQMITGFWF